jgi:hypothetical protein
LLLAWFSFLHKIRFSRSLNPKAIIQGFSI